MPLIWKNEGQKPTIVPFTGVSTLFWLYRPHAFIFSRISTGYSSCTPSKRDFTVYVWYLLTFSKFKSFCCVFVEFQAEIYFFQIESGIELI